MERNYFFMGFGWTFVQLSGSFVSSRRGHFLLFEVGTFLALLVGIFLYVADDRKAGPAIRLATHGIPATDKVI